MNFSKGSDLCIFASSTNIQNTLNGVDFSKDVWMGSKMFDISGNSEFDFSYIWIEHEIDTYADRLWMNLTITPSSSIKFFIGPDTSSLVASTVTFDCSLWKRKI